MAQKFNFPIGGSGKPMAKPAPKPMAQPEPQGEEQGGDVTPEIHQHLQSVHEQTGKAHTHVEHHGDGTHTSHHISESGEVSGPHDHQNLEELKQAFDQFIGEEGKEDSEEGEEY